MAVASIYPELDQAKARIAAIPTDRLREYERDDWLPTASLTRIKFDIAADSFELSEREYMGLCLVRSFYPDLFEGKLLARLFDFDDARFPFVRINYWRTWSRDRDAHLQRALTAFEGAAAKFGPLDFPAWRRAA